MANKRRAIMRIAGVAAVVLILCIALLLGPSIVHFLTQRPFEPEAWRAGDAELRGKMVRDLKASNRLDGLPKSAVIELLGTPDREYRGALSYTIDLGTRFGSTPWTYSLDIELDAGNHVSRYYHHD